MSDPASQDETSEPMRKRWPGWPDIRGWSAIGFFLLTGYSLWMVGANPALLGIPSFMQFVTLLASGGVLLLASNLWSGTKSSSETNAKLADAVKAQAQAPAPPPPPIDPETR